MTAKEYNSIVDLHADGLYRFIVKNIKDEAVAQDVVQDAYEKMWLSHDKVSYDKAKSYLFTTAYHTLIDHIRKNKRMTLMEEHHTAAFYYTSEYTGTQELIDSAIQHLPEAQKSVLLLRDYEGYSYNEISEITGLNESQVKVYIHRARMFMRAYIQKMEAFCNDK